MLSHWNNSLRLFSFRGYRIFHSNKWSKISFFLVSRIGLQTFVREVVWHLFSLYKEYYILWKEIPTINNIFCCIFLKCLAHSKSIIFPHIPAIHNKFNCCILKRLSHWNSIIFPLFSCFVKLKYLFIIKRFKKMNVQWFLLLSMVAYLSDFFINFMT
jgi:hypothetical protein